jgi:hypothetical protein
MRAKLPAKSQPISANKSKRALHQASKALAQLSQQKLRELKARRAMENDLRKIVHQPIIKLIEADPEGASRCSWLSASNRLCRR